MKRHYRASKTNGGERCAWRKASVEDVVLYSLCSMYMSSSTAPSGGGKVSNAAESRPFFSGLTLKLHRIV